MKYEEKKYIIFGMREKIIPSGDMRGKNQLYKSWNERKFKKEILYK